MNSSISFILESFNPVSVGNFIILEDTKVPNTDINKAIVKVRLQTVNERNQNSRFYSREIGGCILESLLPKAKGRSLFQEVDHPLVNTNPDSPDFELSKKRATTIQLSNCGSLIRNLYFDGNDIIGEVETLSGFRGPDLYKLIMLDKADVGFSLRMFGKVEMESDTGIARVAKPVKPITYDTVTNPSHQNAKVISFLPEDINTFIPNKSKNMEMLNESTIQIDDLNVHESNENDIYSYLNDVLTDTFRNIKHVKFNL